jgi:hypothetical protein
VVVVAFLLVGVRVRKVGMAELWGKRVGGTWMFSEGGRISIFGWEEGDRLLRG